MSAGAASIRNQRTTVAIGSIKELIWPGRDPEQVVSEGDTAVRVNVAQSARQYRRIGIRLTPQMHCPVISNVRLKYEPLAHLTLKTDIRLVAFRDNKGRRKTAKDGGRTR